MFTEFSFVLAIKRRELHTNPRLIFTYNIQFEPVKCQMSPNSAVFKCMYCIIFAGTKDKYIIWHASNKFQKALPKSDHCDFIYA